MQAIANAANVPGSQDSGKNVIYLYTGLDTSLICKEITDLLELNGIKGMYTCTFTSGKKIPSEKLFYSI